MRLKHIEIVNNERTGTIFLNRPEVRNALNPGMIAEITSAVKTLMNDPELKVMIIRGKNGTFSSGADLKWLLESGSKSFDQNLAESRLISDLMETLHRVPVPLISVTEGAVFGGALGILGCSDWVFAEKNTRFAFSEVRLGLAPAIIMPYVLNRSHAVKIRQLMLTGRTFDVWEALDAGLADHAGETGEIEKELKKLLQQLIDLPGGAVREIKRLWAVSRPPVDPAITEAGIRSLAELKQSPETRQLLAKFLHKQS
jgi:methylglutaconyl-CoA hydratase